MSSNEMKDLLRDAWKEVFQVADVKDEDNFFECAGDSIKAVQLASWLAQKGVKLDLGTVFTAQTFGKIAETLTETTPMYVPKEILARATVARNIAERAGAGAAASASPAGAAPAPQPANAPQGLTAGRQLCDPNREDPAMPQFYPPYQNLPMMSQPQMMMVPVVTWMMVPVMMPQMPQFPLMSAPPVQQALLNPVNGQPMPQMPAGLMENLSQYYTKPVDAPIANPNVVNFEKPTIGKAEKSAEEVLAYVLEGLIPNFDRDRNLFEQGLTSLDVLKLITRCGENGYKLDMETVFLTPVFSEIAAAMK